MTALPIPHQPSSSTNSTNSYAGAKKNPVSTLKELVARLYREQHKVQDLLSSLGFALRSFNNLNQFLELIPLMAARVSDADGGALILFNRDGQVQRSDLHYQNPQVGQTIRKAIEKTTHQVTSPNGQGGNSQQTPTSMKLVQASFDKLLRDYLEPNIKLFSLPILLKNAEQGHLYIFSHDPQYNWTPTRQKLVRLVADQTAVAIANDELKVELRHKERLDRELEIGADIQIRLLPRQCPEIEGVELAAFCKTANRVGGDYYDFIPTNYDQLGPKNSGDAHLNDDHSAYLPWSIVIGDVMGKGVPAGLIMTMTRGMLRAEVLNGHSPARILEHLNRVMYVDLENSHRFVTLFYSEYDPKTKILSYSNAAHNPPLLWQASTRSIKPLDTAGMLIGLEVDSQYEDSHVQLDSGDTIIYYTDGVTEAANLNGHRFDEDNLTQSFQWACEHSYTAQEILDYLFEQVQQFTGTTTNGDDMTLVVMQVKSRFH
ncbi:GAF domain-containing SpoIIE family protein phosphatase [Moorena bouillonii]|uniref:Guanylate cyclase n=1 Tax=Moorena bouillonii PNG TaxID=568701 RepID=A0A1U7N5Z3_9CYAN|nr:PP2C family protein-serine/threonine phosphatase [Moorena bouillonii]OLT61368.1 guanylate cyclase [Moorena bouillonii PNG]